MSLITFADSITILQWLCSDFHIDFDVRYNVRTDIRFVSACVPISNSKYWTAHKACNLCFSGILCQRYFSESDADKATWLKALEWEPGVGSGCFRPLVLKGTQCSSKRGAFVGSNWVAATNYYHTCCTHQTCQFALVTSPKQACSEEVQCCFDLSDSLTNICSYLQ